MFSRNRIELIGHLGTDPELRFTNDGQPVASMSLATNERWKDRSGKLQERVEWHRIRCWGPLARTVKEHLSKGSYVQVIGRLQSRTFTPQGGEEKRVWEVIAHEVGFLDRRARPGSDADAGAGAAPDSATDSESPPTGDPPF